MAFFPLCNGALGKPDNSKGIKFQMDLSVKRKFESYPKHINPLLVNLRELILSVAKQDGVSDLTETLKWGEPSFVTKSGSTLRLDWKVKKPEQYCIYFNCNTSLVETFKEVYGDTFIFDGNRAIVFQVDDVIPLQALSHCISMSLRYKKIKHLPLLGA